MNPATNRLLKNTGLLYLRLLFLTFVNLYAVRVTLEALGKIDYGVYDVIASVVAALSILTGAMSSASQRFLSFHLGREDHDRYSHTFTLLLLVFAILAGILILIGETIGHFFIYDWLNIPSDRIESAFWVYQASLAAFGIGLITIPYTASIIANERMDAFAIFSVVEGILKLAIAWMLISYGGDRLILYGILTAVISLTVFTMSVGYCHRKFPYCRYVWKWDRNIFSELSQYTGWNLFGSVSAMLANQGQNILLNIYFGPVINAAKAIADRIRNVISGFSVNLYVAASPQIIKSYAAEDYDRALSLVVRTSKMSFLLLFVIAFPLICNMAGVLGIWLGQDGNIPDMAAFSQLILIYCMLLSLEPPLTRIIQATGKIRAYQISVGVITLSYIPIAAIALAMGGSATMTLKVLICVMTVAHAVRLIVVHRQVRLKYDVYLKSVVMPIFKVAFVALPLYWVFDGLVAPRSFWMILCRVAASGIAGLFIAAILGLDGAERSMIFSFVRNKLNKSHSR